MPPEEPPDPEPPPSLPPPTPAPPPALSSSTGGASRRRFGCFFGRRFFDFAFDPAGAFFFAAGAFTRAARSRRRRRFGAFFEAEFPRRRLEPGQRRRDFARCRRQLFRFFAFVGELDVVLGLRQFFGGGDETRVAGAFFARRPEALQPFDHAAVEAGDLDHRFAGAGAGRARGADRSIHLGADRVALDDQLRLAERRRFRRFRGRGSRRFVPAPAAAAGDESCKQGKRRSRKTEPPHQRESSKAPRRLSAPTASGVSIAPCDEPHARPSCRFANGSCRIGAAGSPAGCPIRRR